MVALLLLNENQEVQALSCAHLRISVVVAVVVVVGGVVVGGGGGGGVVVVVVRTIAAIPSQKYSVWPPVDVNWMQMQCCRWHQMQHQNSMYYKMVASWHATKQNFTEKLALTTTLKF